jgi:hypothetical protein
MNVDISGTDMGSADEAQALIGRVFAEGQQVRSANVIAFNLPPIIGLSTTGGFEYELEGLEGQEPAEMNGVMRGLIANANHDARLARVFSTYTARSIWKQRHVGRRQECLDVRRMRDQTRASAAALPEMCAADAACPTNGTVRRIA